tara:strand:+ start:813 stop:1094 length:282 start_codon:yes stop_codon:yes gene_type:complete
MSFLKNLKLKVFDSRTVILNLCTAIGAFGGFPKPPQIFTNLVESYPITQWVLLALLIYQGGGEQDIRLAVELTVIIYVLTNILSANEKKDQEY